MRKRKIKRKFPIAPPVPDDIIYCRHLKTAAKDCITNGVPRIRHYCTHCDRTIRYEPASAEYPSTLQPISEPLPSLAVVRQLDIFDLILLEAGLPLDGK